MTLLFFVSGGVALAYEVIWQRQFALVFGSASPAVAAVLAAYFAGLGLGSLALGSLARRMSRPLLAYAILEAGIALGALLVAPFLAVLEHIYPALFGQLSGAPGVFFSARAALALGTLVIPTFCMGGTLPVLARWLVDSPSRTGPRVGVGLLYAANTLGAALGAVSVPYLLLPLLGLSGTVWLCAALNLGIAAVAWQWDRRSRGSMADREPGTLPDPSLAGHRPGTGGRPVPWRGTLSALAFVSGLATFALQVQWNRPFAQVHENSVHSFAMIAAVFILALAVGAQLARVGLRRGWEVRPLAGMAWLTGGAGMLWGPSLFESLTGGLALLEASQGWWQHAFRLGGMAMLVLFLPFSAGWSI